MRESRTALTMSNPSRPEATTKLSITLPLDRWQPDRGGAERYLDQLVRALCARGHCVTVLCLESNLTDDVLPPRLSIERLSVPRFPRFWRERAFAVASTEQHVRAQRDLLFAARHAQTADVYQPHGGCFLKAKAGALAHLSGVRRGLRRAIAAVRPTTRVLLGLDREIFLRSPKVAVISLSEKVERDFQAAYPDVNFRFRRVYNGVDLDAFHDRDRIERTSALRAAFPIPAEHSIGVFLAYHFGPKGLEHALAAVAQTENWTLLVGGRSEAGPFRRVAARLGIANRVFFLGRVANTREVLAAADALLLPSYYDPCALVVLEALACGTPVITTRQNGSGELVREGESGFVLTDPRQESQMARSLEKIAADWERYHRGALAQRKLLDWNDHVDRIEGVLCEVALQKVGSGSRSVQTE